MLSLHFRKHLEGNRHPQGGEAEAEEQAAAGRRMGLEAVTEQAAGYKTADAFWTKVLVSMPKVERADSLVQYFLPMAR
jgi:hypothetical protein